MIHRYYEQQWQACRKRDFLDKTGLSGFLQAGNKNLPVWIVSKNAATTASFLRLLEKCNAVVIGYICHSLSIYNEAQETGNKWPSHIEIARISDQRWLQTMRVTLFFSVSPKNFSHFILSCICFAQCFFFFFPKAPWMIYDFLTPHPTRLHKEQWKTSDWAKLKKNTQTFPKWISSWLQSANSFRLTKSAPSLPSAPRFCEDPSDFLSLLTVHYDQLSVWLPAMSRNVQFSRILPFSLKVNVAVGLQKQPH